MNKLEQIELIVSEMSKLGVSKYYDNRAKCYDIIEMLIQDKLKFPLDIENIKYLLTP